MSIAFFLRKIYNQPSLLLENEKEEHSAFREFFGGICA